MKKLIIDEKNLYKNIDNLDLKIKEIKTIILNYSELIIFKISKIKRDEIEKYIEKEIITKYENVLLHYEIDKRSKETYIYIYKECELLNDIVGRKNIKVIPIELYISKCIKNKVNTKVKITNRTLILEFNNNYLSGVSYESYNEEIKEEYIFDTETLKFKES
ncbi:hypothetical protein [Clostridium chrysemydis]|uniref:hypothetical protein n=1 Tax=Clostridium chrysemydis TaxID=2665504 RepID=UPI001884335F|nr:hypothetical protein [Clostridium chrysemydis]